MPHEAVFVGEHTVAGTEKGGLQFHMNSSPCFQTCKKGLYIFNILAAVNQGHIVAFNKRQPGGIVCKHDVAAVDGQAGVQNQVLDLFGHGVIRARRSLAIRQKLRSGGLKNLRIELYRFTTVAIEKNEKIHRHRFHSFHI